MTYYRGNDVYDRISTTSNLLFAPRGSWALVYGDSSATPKLVVIAKEDSVDFAKPFVDAVRSLAAAAGVPLRAMSYDGTAPFSSVSWYDPSTNTAKTISSAELADEFRRYLPSVSLTTTRKAQNTAVSSDFHAWQRTHLGKDITVSDIDLLRINPANGNAPQEVIELKRSSASVGAWRPYPDDFANFNLIYNLIKSSGCRFTIAYNVFTKPARGPRVDDASTLSIFEWKGDNHFVHDTTLAFDAFEQGSYL